MLTADTITDEQIRELRWHGLWDSELPYRHVVELCDVALGTRCASDPQAYRSARAKCADIINNRAAKVPTPARTRQAVDPTELRDTIEDSLSCQYRKLLDHGGGLAIAALKPVVRDIANNVAMAVLGLIEAEEMEKAS